MLENAIRKEKKQLHEQGELMKGLEVAKIMLQDGEPIEKIKRYTGLSEEQIRKLQQELQSVTVQ